MLNLRIFKGEFPESKAVVLSFLVASQFHRVYFKRGFSSRGPVFVALDPASLHHGGQHHNQGTLRFVDHMPKVVDGVWQRSLSCYVSVNYSRAWNLHVHCVSINVVSAFGFSEYHSRCIVYKNNYVLLKFTFTKKKILAPVFQKQLKKTL